MCSFGPMILGYKHPRVEAAAAVQRGTRGHQPGRAACMVELAELLVERVAHADWAIFAKNGTDATTTCASWSRGPRPGRHKVLAAAGAYHGAAPWAALRMDGDGTGGARTRDLHYYDYNDAGERRARDRRGRRRQRRGDHHLAVQARRGT